MPNRKKYVWCTYREWSFKILEAIQDIEDWETGLIITTDNCLYNTDKFKNKNIPVLEVEPKQAKKEFQKGGIAYEAIIRLQPETIITPGWSWYIPKEILSFKPCVTYHPGKLPKDRGGSPIQNQIRNGESWTYVNVMKQEEGLDEGSVYLKRKISLDGYADDVWSKMTSAGVLLTREFLQGMASGSLKPEAQADEEPILYKRVESEDAELKPSEQDVYQMLNIIRAHYEKDPNSYVVPAYINIDNNIKLEVYRASLESELNMEKKFISPNEDYGDEIHQIVNSTNNCELKLILKDRNGDYLYLTQINVRLKRKIR